MWRHRDRCYEFTVGLSYAFSRTVVPAKTILTVSTLVLCSTFPGSFACKRLERLKGTEHFHSGKDREHMVVAGTAVGKSLQCAAYALTGHGVREGESVGDKQSAPVKLQGKTHRGALGIVC